MHANRCLGLPPIQGSNRSKTTLARRRGIFLDGLHQSYTFSDPESQPTLLRTQKETFRAGIYGT
jgi:hypothetical protein